MSVLVDKTKQNIRTLRGADVFLYGGPEKSALRIGAAPLDRDQDGSNLKGMFFMDSKHGKKFLAEVLTNFKKRVCLY